MTTVNEILAKYTVSTDVITEVDPTTEKHYSLNLRYKIIREEKEYFLSIKKVEVYCTEKKDHVRLDVDTNLPKTVKQDDIEKAEKLVARYQKEVEMWKTYVIKFKSNTRFERMKIEKYTTLLNKAEDKLQKLLAK